jgi:hypothetical protein
MQNDTFYGIDPQSQEFADIIDTACHYVGGRQAMYSLVLGTKPGSKTMTSDSLTLVLALGQSAIDLHKPMFAFRLAQAFMAANAANKDALTADEIADIEVLFLTAMRDSNPTVAALFGVTDDTLANYKNFSIRATNGIKNL